MQAVERGIVKGGLCGSRMVKEPQSFLDWRVDCWLNKSRYQMFSFKGSHPAAWPHLQDMWRRRRARVAFELLPFRFIDAVT